VIVKNTPIVPISSLTGRVYLVQGEKGSILVDALTNRYSKTILNTVMQTTSDLHSKVSLILITHAHIDHYGGAPYLKRKLGVPIAIHQLDADDMRRGRNGALCPRSLSERILKLSLSRLRAEPIEPDIVLDGEEGDLRDYGIEAKWVRTPGHSEGSISVVFPGEIAIVGDLVIGRFGFSRKPAYPLWVKDVRQLRESIKRVMDFSPKVFFSGHGGPFSAEEVKRVFLE
jgi:glyoxylase-like metal-dependent hydrolase (beta-lactamase superfamily II)